MGIKKCIRGEDVFSIRNITKKLGKFKLNNINLELKEGDIVGIIGPNGSGKTTLIKNYNGDY